MKLEDANASAAGFWFVTDSCTCQHMQCSMGIVV